MTTSNAATPQRVPCPLCGQPLDLRLARGRKSGKPSVMLICPRDGRHFRGFITDREYVQGVLNKLEANQTALEANQTAKEGTR